MKHFMSLSLLALLLPGVTASLETTSLRGTGKDLERAIFGGSPAVHRALDDTCVEGSYTSDTDALCCMPLQLDHDFLMGNMEISVTLEGQQGPNESEISYWYVTVDSDPVLGGSLAGLSMNAWCVDLSRGFGAGVFTLDVFSTYDDWNYDNALDSPEKLPNVNWLINTYRLGDEVTVPASHNENCGAQDEVAEVDWRTMQNAVWRIVDRGLTADGAYENADANKCLEWFLIAEADANGNNFEPDCNDPDAELAILMILDDDSVENTIEAQVIIGEVKLSNLPGACTPQECCEELVVDHEVFQENKEIEVQFSQTGSSGAAWDVQFLQGSDVYSTSLGVVEAWSVDLDREDFSGTFAVDTYSVYDNWYRFNAIDKKQNIPKVNWLINERPVGTVVPGGTGSCGGASVSISDFQNAVWDLMDFATENRGSPNACVVSWLYAEAESFGEDYEPSCDSDDKIAVLLIIDDGDTYKQKFSLTGGKLDDVEQLVEGVVNQVIIAAVPIAEVAGSCVMQECGCCELLTLPPASSPTDPRENPTESSPVEEILTPAPAPSPGRCEDTIDILGSEFGDVCGHKGVELLNTNPHFESGSGNVMPALRVDIRDTFFGITTGSEDTSVAFRVQNPFEGGAVDMYIQYETDSGAGGQYVTCAAEPGVDECEFLNGGEILQAVCIDPRIHDPSKQPYAIVSAFFVESGGDLFDITLTANVPECCEPDPANTGSVVSFTFEILCTCPGDSNASSQ
mmetsp:Transcript_26014/g.39964  ORF Transcript_26014/g.39964 Transcript_26014/m.39964 type:complete len:740 (+) Transcript_26014:71-2290(+)